jgi:putative lysine/arginine/ornithine/histidine/octopine transport system substrate-binding protein
MNRAGVERSRAAVRRRVAASLALAAIVAAFALPAPGRAAAAEGELRVIVGGTYAPFEYYQADGTLAGFDIDIANAICVVLARRCTFVDVPFDQTIPALTGGRGDAIISSMAITEERKQLVAFTNRYYRTPMRMVARKGFDRPISRDGLKGLKLGAAPDTTAASYAQAAFGGAAEIVTTIGGDDEIDLYRALVEGKVDLVLSDMLAIWQFVASPEGRDIVFVGDPIHVDEDIGIAVRKDDDVLRERLNAAIARVRLDGTYAKINTKYFPFSIY